MMWTKNNLKKPLKEMGIAGNDTLLVHSSMKSIGGVKGAADAVLDSLMDYMSDGLLVLPALSYATVDAEHPLFSVTDTPTCVGVLTELFRKRSGAIRSAHPTHSVAAVGRDAEPFTRGHELDDTPCARSGPWGKLLDLDAKVLFIGTGISCNTFLHGVEEWNKVPDYFTKEPERLKVVKPDGETVERGYFRHNQHNSEHYAKMESLFIASGAMSAGKFGDAKYHLGTCLGMERIVTGLLKKDIRLFSHDNLPV